MNRRITFISTFLFLFLFSGCNIMPSPESIIAPPGASVNISAGNEDVSSILSGFLPEGSAPIAPIKGSDSKSIYMKDIDGDGIDEIIIIYKNQKQGIKSGLMVLKKGSETWSKIFEDNDNFSEIESLNFFDITGDNAPEIFIERNNLLLVHIYYGGHITRYGINGCSSYSISDLPSECGTDGMLELLVMYEDYSHLNISIRRWNGTRLVYVENEYPDYLKEIVAFYVKRTSEKPTSYSIWRSLSDAQKKMGMYKEAMGSMEKALSIMKDTSTAFRVKILNAEYLIQSGKYEDARNIYNSIINAEKSNDTILYKSQAKDGIGKSYEAEKDYDKARLYYKSISDFPYDDRIQKIDAITGEDSIYNYIKKEGIEKAAGKIAEWGRTQNLIISCTDASSIGNSINGLLFVDYHIDPSKAYGKENVGGHVIYWMNNGKLCHQIYFTLDMEADSPFSDHGLTADLTASKVVFNYNSGFIELNVTFKNPQDKDTNRTFLFHNNMWKLFWK